MILAMHHFHLVKRWKNKLKYSMRGPAGVVEISSPTIAVCYAMVRQRIGTF